MHICPHVYSAQSGTFSQQTAHSLAKFSESTFPEEQTVCSENFAGFAGSWKFRRTSRQSEEPEIWPPVLQNLSKAGPLSGDCRAVWESRTACPDCGRSTESVGCEIGAGTGMRGGGNDTGTSKNGSKMGGAFRPRDSMPAVLLTEVVIGWSITGRPVDTSQNGLKVCWGVVRRVSFGVPCCISVNPSEHVLKFWVCCAIGSHPFAAPVTTVDWLRRWCRAEVRLRRPRLLANGHPGSPEGSLRVSVVIFRLVTPGWEKTNLLHFNKI